MQSTNLILIAVSSLAIYILLIADDRICINAEGVTPKTEEPCGSDKLLGKAMTQNLFDKLCQIKIPNIENLCTSASDTACEAIQKALGFKYSYCQPYTTGSKTVQTCGVSNNNQSREHFKDFFYISATMETSPQICKTNKLKVFRPKCGPGNNKEPIN